MVNSIWGGGTTLPNWKKIREKNGECSQDDFLLVLPKSSRTTFKTNFETLSALGDCHVTIIGGVLNKKSMIFRFLEYMSATFWYFFMKTFLVLRSYRVLVINIKILIMSPLVTLKTRLKVLILAVFWQFWAFFVKFVLAKVFSLWHWFFTKTQFIVYGFTCSKRFFHDVKLWANNQYNADQIFVKSALWSGPYKVPFSVLLIRKTWNLVSV